MSKDHSVSEGSSLDKSDGSMASAVLLLGCIYKSFGWRDFTNVSRSDVMRSVMDREYMQSVIDKLEEAGIESLFTGQTEQNVWKRMIHFMEAAVDLQEELNLDLDKQMWGYSLLSVL